LLKKYLKLGLFTIRHIIPIYVKLKDLNIKNISFFNFLNWRNGYCYFRGVYNKKEVFIKIDTKFHLLINDKLAYDLCKGVMQDNLVDLLYSSLDGRIQFLVYEFFHSNELDEDILLNNMRYLDDIIRILNNLSDAGIIHRDIKLDNFLVSNNKLKIIDFTFANSNIHKEFKEVDVKNSYNCFLLEFLGAGLNPSPFVWDDFYSLHSILKKIEKDAKDPQEVKLNTYVKEIMKSVGKMEYRITCGTGYYFLSRKIKIKIKEMLGIDHRYRRLY